MKRVHPQTWVDDGVPPISFDTLPADDEFDQSRYEPSERKQRTPIGQTLAKKFPHLEYASIPEVDAPGDWPFEIVGEVDNPSAFKLSELVGKFPRVGLTTDFHCITGWSVLDTRWTGIRGSDLVEFAQPHDTVTTVLVHGLDEFSTCLWVEDFMRGIIAYGYRDKPLSAAHGFPLRFIAPPHLWQYKGCKWVQKIEFLTEHRLGFWEIRAYSDSALVEENDRYANPLAHAGTPIGKLRKQFEKKGAQ